MWRSHVANLWASQLSYLSSEGARGGAAAFGGPPGQQGFQGQQGGPPGGGPGMSQGMPPGTPGGYGQPPTPGSAPRPPAPVRLSSSFSLPRRCFMTLHLPRQPMFVAPRGPKICFVQNDPCSWVWSHKSKTVIDFPFWSVRSLPVLLQTAPLLTVNAAFAVQCWVCLVKSPAALKCKSTQLGFRRSLDMTMHRCSSMRLAGRSSAPDRDASSVGCRARTARRPRGTGGPLPATARRRRRLRRPSPRLRSAPSRFWHAATLTASPR